MRIVHVALPLALVLAIRDAASVNPLLLVFGVSGDYGWGFLLPWVTAGLTVVVALAAVVAWKEGWWSRWHRIHYGLVAAACVAFLVVVGLLGLL